MQEDHIDDVKDASFMMHLGNAIDNVYNNTAEREDRRTSASIKGNCLVIDFRTILRAAKDEDLHRQISLLDSEAKQMIASRLKTIKECYKECSGKRLKSKEVDKKDNIETLTVSPYNPIRTLKYTVSCTFEIS